MSATKTLVVFYSRSGTTRRIAEALSRALTCDLEEIIEPKPRTGFLGYMRSLLEARRKRPSVIAPIKHDVSSYDLVVVGTPVWAWSLSSPVRAYLMTTASQLPEVAFFCTLGGKGSEKHLCADDGHCRQAASRRLRNYTTGSAVGEPRSALGVCEGGGELSHQKNRRKPLIKWREFMENATFRKWLTEQGCHFDTQHEGRGEGHGTLTIRREGRTAEMPLVGLAPRARPAFSSPGLRSTRPRVVGSSRTEGSRLKRPGATRNCLAYQENSMASDPPTFAVPPGFLGFGRRERDAAISIAGIPLDIGTTNRSGARFGPQAIRQASRMLVDGAHPTAWIDPSRNCRSSDIGDFRIALGDIPASLQTDRAAGRRRRPPRRAWRRARHHARRCCARWRGARAPLALVHFDAHVDTWPDNFGQPYAHGSVFYHAIEEAPRRSRAA